MASTNENRLRGSVLNGTEQPEEVRNPDSELRLDDEPDTLYDDGLNVEDDSETLADTHHERNTG